MQPRWHEPSKTAEGELLQHVLHLEQIVKARKGSMCKGAMCKMNCMDEGCGSGLKGEGEKGNYMAKASMAEKNKYCQKHFGCSYSECTPKQKSQCNQNCGSGEGNKGNYMVKASEDEDACEHCNRPIENYSDYTSRDGGGNNPGRPSLCNKCAGVEKGLKGGQKKLDKDKDGKITGKDFKMMRGKDEGEETGSYKSDRGQKMPTLKGRGGMESNFSLDKTAEFLRSKGVIIKYEQEASVENSVPQFMDHSGGTPIEARAYQTNGTYPDFNTVAPKKSAISEVAKMPAFAKTGYDEKGSSVHMHLTDGGDRKDGNWNIAPIEERRTQLRKGYGNPGLIEEIASLMENVAKNL